MDAVSAAHQELRPGHNSIVLPTRR